MTTITGPVDPSSTAANAPQSREPTPSEENNNDEDNTPDDQDTDPDDQQDTDEDSTSDTDSDEQQNNDDNNTPHDPDDQQHTDANNKASAAMADQPNTHTKRTSTNDDPLPSLDPIAWAGINKRSEVSGAQRSHKPFWSRVFVAGYPQSPVQVGVNKDDFSTGDEPENMCVTCPEGGDVVCIGETHYGFCDEGCAEPRRLGEGMRCVGGRITGARG